MNTEELLKHLSKALKERPGLIDDIDTQDICNMVYLDLQCRRQLYPISQFRKVENYFEHVSSQIEAAKQKRNSFAMISYIEQLASCICLLPDSEYVSDFIEQANMDHLRLEHILQKTVYVIGDSHVNFFSGNEELSFIPVGNGINTCKQVADLPFSVFHMGPCLAYNSNSYATTSCFREKLDFLLSNIIEEKARIMFVMGEIDIRVHVFKQCKIKNCSYEVIIDDIVEQYMNMMRNVQKKDFQIYCFGPIASQSESLHADKEFITCGTEIERNKATSYFTKVLMEKCKEETIVFFSIFDKMITEDWHTKTEFLCKDGCHLGQNALNLVKDVLSFS